MTVFGRFLPVDVLMSVLLSLFPLFVFRNRASCTPCQHIVDGIGMCVTCQSWRITTTYVPLSDHIPKGE